MNDDESPELIDPTQGLVRPYVEESFAQNEHAIAWVGEATTTYDAAMRDLAIEVFDKMPPPRNGVKTFDPATIALIMQIVATLVPMIIKRCNKDVEAIQQAARQNSVRHRVVVNGIVRVKVGWQAVSALGGFRQCPRVLLAAAASPNATESLQEMVASPLMQIAMDKVDERDVAYLGYKRID